MGLGADFDYVDAMGASQLEDREHVDGPNFTPLPSSPMTSRLENRLNTNLTMGQPSS